jgi:hypothetical protein
MRPALSTHHTGRATPRVAPQTIDLGTLTAALHAPRMATNRWMPIGLQVPTTTVDLHTPRRLNPQAYGRQPRNATDIVKS